MLAANVLMGKALLKNGDAQGAEVTFAKALKLGADRAEVIVPMAQAYLAQGKYDTLLERITPEGLLPRQTQIEILILRGTRRRKAATRRPRCARSTTRSRSIRNRCPSGWRARIS